MERESSEINQNFLTFLQRNSWEIALIGANWNFVKCYSKILSIEIEADLSFIEIKKTANCVTTFPSFTKHAFGFSSPFLDSESIKSKGRLIIANPIIVREGREEGAPTNLHKTISLEKNFIVKDSLKDACVCSYGSELRTSLELQAGWVLFLEPSVC